MQQRFTAVVLICIQAYLLGNYAQSFRLPTLGICIAMLGLLPRLRLKTKPLVRWILRLAWSSVCALQGWMMAQPDIMDEWLVPAQLVVATATYLIGIQLMELFFRRDDDLLPQRFILITLITLVVLFCRQAYSDTKTLLFLHAIVTVTLVGLFLQSSRAEGTFRHPTQNRKFTSGRWTVLAITSICVAVITFYASTQLSRNIEYVQSWLAQAITLSIRRDTQMAYSTQATLDNITASKLASPNKVALRVYCDTEPGYLRGRVFDHLERDTWWRHEEYYGSGRKFLGSPLATAPEGVKEKNRNQIFSIGNNTTGPWKKVEISNIPERGRVYFTLLGTDLVQGRSLSARWDEHGCVHGDFSVRENYTCYVSPQSRGAPPDPSLYPTLLQVPDSLATSLQSRARYICAGRTTDAGRIDAIEEYFRSGFRYSLENHTQPKQGNRLLHFIQTSREGHCEFFASGAVILLRLQGIPCRYVTGYTVTELQTEHGEYWLARNRNAHAWAEAYDRDRKRWVIVEATPGMNVSENLWDSGTNASDSLAAGIRDQVTEFADAFDYSLLLNWAWLRNWLNDIGIVLQRPLNITLLLILVAWVIRRTYRNWKASRDDGIDPRFRREGLLLRRLSRRLQRYQLVRGPSETIHQFVERIRARSATEPWLADAAHWYLQYAARRYAAAEDLPPLPPLPSKHGTTRR
ncbi:MAG: hypothetical protein CL681_23470 [Blastopirellula sp.]|nr:hypothetical protein [Blastopirellula sp.]